MIQAHRLLPATRSPPTQRQQEAATTIAGTATTAARPSPSACSSPPLRSRTLRGLLYCETTTSTHSTSALSDRARHHHHSNTQAGVDRPRAAGGMEENKEKGGKQERARVRTMTSSGRRMEEVQAVEQGCECSDQHPQRHVLAGAGQAADLFYASLARRKARVRLGGCVSLVRLPTASTHNLCGTQYIHRMIPPSHFTHSQPTPRRCGCARPTAGWTHAWLPPPLLRLLPVRRRL